MKPLDLTTFTTLGEYLGAVGPWFGKEPLDFAKMIALRQHFIGVLRDENLSLPASKESISDLLLALDKFIDMLGEEESAAALTLGQSIKWKADKTKTILMAELKTQNCYVVAPKRAYSVRILTEDATKIFSQQAYILLADIERYDIQQAGKCLAFETPTAAAFHLLRAMDSVIRRYHESVTQKGLGPRFRAWGTYITSMRKQGAPERILSVIEQVKDLHRNPVIHPDQQVSMDQAISMVGIAESLITAILAEMEDRAVADANDALAAASIAVKAAPLRADSPDKEIPF